MKNMSRMFWAFVSCICLALPCRAVEQYKFRLIDVPDGLSDNQIRGLSMVRTACRDKDGLDIEHLRWGIV